METSVKRTQRDYTMAFKLAVVEQVEKGELTYKQAQAKYGIQGRTTVLTWMRKHGPSRVGPCGIIGGDADRQESQTPDTGAADQGAAGRARASAGESQVLRSRRGRAEEGLRRACRKKACGQVLSQDLVKGLSVCRACQYMGISRQAYYQGRQRNAERGQRAEAVVKLVNEQRLRQPLLGTRKLHHLLRESLEQAGVGLGRDALFDVLRNARMLVPTRRAYHKTTDSHHRFRRHPNLVKEGPEQIQVTRSEQLWVADITYLPTADRFVYLSLVTDAHSRKIVGWHVHPTLQTEEVAQAMKMALRGRQTRLQLTHHSDRGIQYCSSHYQALHRRHGVKCSMTDGYDCYQNALAERVNGILKNEFLLSRPADLAQARRMVAESIQIYNHKRPHLSLKMQTPDVVHRASMAG